MVKSTFAIHFALPMVVLAGLLLAEHAFALGDEVDYSAPYLTVENGELVTKYPAKEHSKVQPAADRASAGKAEPAAKGVRQLQSPLGIIAGLVAAAAVFLMHRWKRRERNIDSHD